MSRVRPVQPIKNEPMQIFELNQYNMHSKIYKSSSITTRLLFSCVDLVNQNATYLNCIVSLFIINNILYIINSD